MQARIGSWMKAAIGVAVSKDMKVMRFGDNMRNVAVTEGDKVEVRRSSAGRSTPGSRRSREGDECRF